MSSVCVFNTCYFSINDPIHIVWEEVMLVSVGFQYDIQYLDNSFIYQNIGNISRYKP